ncbi:transcription antitermination protein NusB [Listeria floridensis FSL S10-1187]|uniref:Transcription antitermination protein NusB n=1 Tax=Listeria floridensis FSL S10-1187 TaxID=1265817 RepID=A0ABP3AYT8_9LIST|nr:transcription antitermination factor NusB [Listeria floridensis]EUJ31787.1 transcription antitermination protein NusB [Listeria floridensis FSL S10-1187]
MKRREARERALQALFQMELNEMTAEQAITNVMDEEEDDYVKKLVFGVSEHKQELDQKIEAHLENWKLDRLNKVDLSILRVGAFEMLYLEDVPDRVSLNESIEIAKVYSDEKAGKFINGVLANIAQND